MKRSRKSGTKRRWRRWRRRSSHLLARIIIRHSKSTHQPRRDTRNFPIQSALTIPLVRAKPQRRPSNHQDDPISNHDRILLIRIQFPPSFLRLPLGLLPAFLGLLLCIVGDLGCALGRLARLVFGFVLEARGLRAGLYLLGFVVGVDGGDVRGIDVDEGGGFGFGFFNLGKSWGAAVMWGKRLYVRIGCSSTSLMCGY